MKEVSAARDSNRNRMPVVAAFVDELRAMGFPPKVVYAKENGATVGKPPVDVEVFQIPAGIDFAPTARARR